jgi:hypothetical protein
MLKAGDRVNASNGCEYEGTRKKETPDAKAVGKLGIFTGTAGRS